MAYIPHPLVKMMLIQPLREGSWENWLAKLQEFDIDVRPIKVVKGKGICNLISGIDVVNLKVPPPRINCTLNYRNDWYQHLVLYLETSQFLVEMSSKEKIALKMKENSYVLISSILIRRIFDGVLLRCLPLGTIEETLRDMHKGVFGGHFSP